MTLTLIKNETAVAEKQPRFNYTGHGWEGDRYDSNLSLKEIAKILRTEFKAEFP